jgi:hypothetical protein
MLATRHGRQRDQRQKGADAQHIVERAHRKEDRVGAVHERRTKHHAHGIQVVGHPGHDVAGAVALVEARILALQVKEEVVAQIELDLPRYADQNPALSVKKDALDQRDGDQQPGEEQNLLAGYSVLHLVDGHLQDPGKLHRDRIGGDARQSAPHISPSVAAHVFEERGQIAKHGPIVRGGAGSSRSVLTSNLTLCGESHPETNRPIALQMARAPSFRLFSGERVGNLRPQTHL